MVWKSGEDPMLMFIVQYCGVLNCRLVLVSVVLQLNCSYCLCIVNTKFIDFDFTESYFSNSGPRKSFFVAQF